MDPRVKTSLADLQLQHTLSLRCYEGRETAKRLMAEVSAGKQQDPGFASIESAFAGLFGILHETDMPPTTQTISAVAQTTARLKELQVKWDQLKNR